MNIKIITLLLIIIFICPVYAGAISIPIGLSLEYGYGSSIIPLYYHNDNKYIDIFSSITKWDGYDTDILLEVKPFNKYTKIYLYSAFSSSIDMRNEDGILIGEYKCGINRLGYENDLHIGKLNSIVSLGIEDNYVYLYHEYKIYGKFSFSFSFRNIIIGTILEGSVNNVIDDYSMSIYVYRQLMYSWILSGLLKTGYNQSEIVVSFYRKDNILPLGVDIGLTKDSYYITPYFLYYFKRYGILFSMSINKYPYYVFSLESNIGLTINF